MNTEILYENLRSLSQTVLSVKDQVSVLRNGAESSKHAIQLNNVLCEASAKLTRDLNDIQNVTSLLRETAKQYEYISDIDRATVNLEEHSSEISIHLKAIRRKLIPLNSILGEKKDSRPGYNNEVVSRFQVGLIQVLNSILYVLSLLSSCLKAQLRELEGVSKSSRKDILLDTKTTELNQQIIEIREQFDLILVPRLTKVHQVLLGCFKPVLDIEGILETSQQLTNQIASNIQPIHERHTRLLEKLTPLKGLKSIFFGGERRAIQILDRSGFGHNQLVELKGRLTHADIKLSADIAPKLEYQTRELLHNYPGDHTLDTTAMDVRAFETKLKRALSNFLPQCEANRSLIEKLCAAPTT
ncbi:hypothetical protein [Teredinibacter sp. KSP-S5-2]|uniref:hypothetical protein n=1 Tax=Teredinibacter sp. KSP-S5-2 TaxID=3034506 RepID=UPI0029346F63|nr:hypothetical protein [Teredinibacter sp. KSP-S5-2]WNO09213.1 hypothetical protein P5V12_19920 [Teredinibacter sp. KSP-S5-2]